MSMNNINELVSIDNDFYLKVPFTKEIINKIFYQKEICSVSYPRFDNYATLRVLAIGISNKSYPNAIILRESTDVEYLLQMSNSGEIRVTSNMLMYCKYTGFKTYKSFIPSLYQSCVVRNSSKAYWYVAVCKEIIENKPIFYEDEKPVEILPLNKYTECLIGTETSWKEFVFNKVKNNYETV